MKNVKSWIEKKLESLNGEVKKLDLSNAGLTDEDVAFLCEGLADSSVIYIEKLDLSSNILTAASAKDLFMLKKVGSLDVSNNYLGDEGLEILNKNKSFKSIHTSGNGITEKITTTEEENLLESLIPHTDSIEETNEYILQPRKKIPLSFMFKNEPSLNIEKEKKSPRDITQEKLQQFFEDNKENIEKLSTEEIKELQEKFSQLLQGFNVSYKKK